MCANGLDERSGRIRGETDEVDHRVGAEVSDASAEDAVCVLLLPVGDDVSHLLPFGPGGVSGAGAVRDLRDLVSGTGEAGKKEPMCSVPPVMTICLETPMNE
jgi:hypothetical protein